MSYALWLLTQITMVFGAFIFIILDLLMLVVVNTISESAIILLHM